MQRMTSSSGQINLNCLKKRTIEVLQAVRRPRLKLNRSKCQFNQRQLTFFGHTIFNKGTASDAIKIKAITDMPEPTNQPKGTTTTLLRHDYIHGKVSPKPLNQNSTPTSSGGHYLVLWQASKGGTSKPKKMITQSPILMYFDPKLPIKVSSDASAQGLGVLWEQMHENEWHPIAYTCSHWHLLKQNNCALKLEILSILFAFQYFYEYIYGQRFIIRNDHKPLKSIMNK